MGIVVASSDGPTGATTGGIDRTSVLLGASTTPSVTSLRRLRFL